MDEVMKIKRNIKCWRCGYQITEARRQEGKQLWIARCGGCNQRYVSLNGSLFLLI